MKSSERRRVLRVDASTYSALEAFRQIASEVLAQGEHVEVDVVVELAIHRGLDALLRDLVGRVDNEILLKTIEQLAQEHPQVVYRFVVDRMRAGDIDYLQFVDSWKGFLDADTT